MESQELCKTENPPEGGCSVGAWLQLTYSRERANPPNTKASMAGRRKKAIMAYNAHMENNVANQITVQTVVNAPVEKVWEYYINPVHIVKWNNASPDWHTPRAENDLRVGGKFLSRMEAKDGSAGFDFSGTYTHITPQRKIEYVMDGDDKRKVIIEFIYRSGVRTKVVVTFDAENENSLEMQKNGWQAILDNFKTYVEEN